MLSKSEHDVTVILPAMDETHSLSETVRILLEQCGDDIREFIIVMCDRTTPQTKAVAEDLRRKYPDLVVIHFQTLRFLGGAIREAFDLARGAYTLMMASDMETDPNDAKDFIAQIRRSPDAIVTGSRWQKGIGFKGYSPLKLILNWVFQRMFGILYGTKLSDMTFGYRLFPTPLVQQIKWEELRHAFLFETLVKPLRLGVSVVEIPSCWKARAEGASYNTFSQNFVYFKTGWRTRWASRSSILREGHPTIR